VAVAWVAQVLGLHSEALGWVGSGVERNFFLSCSQVSSFVLFLSACGHGC
jgi:hypothetical protein